MTDDQKRIGVVIMNLGGPTSAESVRTFLYNLFSDTDIIKLGGGTAQNVLAKTISKFRSPKVAEKYRLINEYGCPNGCSGNEHCPNKISGVVSGCCSPINRLTEDQRIALEDKLKELLPGNFVRVYTAMRYWIPFAETTMNEIREDKIDELVLLPLYPHFSWTTVGSSYNDWEKVKNRQIKEQKVVDWVEYHIKSYHLNEKYLSAVNERIDDALAVFDEETRNRTHLIFSAHGTPISEVESGDPYTRQIAETVEAIMNRRRRKEQYWLSFQSRVGPSKWTQPNTEDLVIKLLGYGIKNILMVPIAFVTDHIETLHELSVELKETIEEQNLDYEHLNVMPGLNDHPLFIEAMAEEVLNAMHETKPEESEKSLTQNTVST